ncbi:MAG: glycosyltransferase family 4 protein [Pseudomonadales bacterium]
MPLTNPIAKTELILGNSNKRFSGVTSTMLQVLSRQWSLLPVAVLGDHFLPKQATAISFLSLVKHGRSPLADGRFRIFHARRNNEMIQALILKTLFRVKIKIVFTSTAQRHHTGFTRWLIKQMDGIISTCDAAAGYLERPADIIIPHGIDTNVYYPSENKDESWAKLGLPGKYGIGIFGRVREQKGLDRLIDAALPLLKKYPDFTIVITGQVQSKDQAYFDEQLKKVEQAGLQQQVVYLGELPFAQIPALVRSMSIIAALSRNEGFGLTVLEAMASGVAVLTSDAGAWPEVVRNGIDGHTVSSNNNQVLSDTLAKMLESPETLHTMGAQGRQRIEQYYTIEREAECLVNYFKTLNQ